MTPVPNRSQKLPENNHNQQTQSASVSPEDIKKLEDDMSSLKQQLDNHQTEVVKCNDYYMEVTKNCAQQWKMITFATEGITVR